MWTGTGFGPEQCSLSIPIPIVDLMCLCVGSGRPHSPVGAGGEGQPGPARGPEFTASPHHRQPELPPGTVSVGPQSSQSLESETSIYISSNMSSFDGTGGQYFNFE